MKHHQPHQHPPATHTDSSTTTSALLLSTAHFRTAQDELGKEVAVKFEATGDAT